VCLGLEGKVLSHTQDEVLSEPNFFFGQEDLVASEKRQLLLEQYAGFRR
jgi:hypothetical protein